MPLSSTISMHISTRCAADPALAGARFSSGFLTTVTFMDFRFAPFSRKNANETPVVYQPRGVSLSIVAGLGRTAVL